MKRILAVLFVMLGCGLVAEPAPSQASQEFPFTSGNAFVRLCSVIDKNQTTEGDFAQFMACLGYVQGVAQGVLAEVKYAEVMTGKAPIKPFCPPEEVPNGQLIRVPLKYIRNHPERAHMPTTELFFYALGEAFPCK